MEPVTWLMCLCVAMFLGAAAAGAIPLTMSMSERRLHLVTTFGAGLLVGTALVVIIPEGVAMHYEGQRRHAVDAAAAASALAAAPAAARRLGEAVLSAAPASALGVGVGAGPAADGLGHDHGHDHDADEFTHEHPGHWEIGAALAIGFAFQLVVGERRGREPPREARGRAGGRGWREHARAPSALLSGGAP
jgi:solute carrier family 39 (zinc transporter), member 9